MSLSNVWPPQLILLGKSELISICWEIGLNVSLAAAPVTGVNTNDFAKEFFDLGIERLLSR